MSSKSNFESQVNTFRVSLEVGTEKNVSKKNDRCRIFKRLFFKMYTTFKAFCPRNFQVRACVLYTYKEPFSKANIICSYYISKWQAPCLYVIVFKKDI